MSDLKSPFLSPPPSLPSPSITSSSPDEGVESSADDSDSSAPQIAFDPYANTNTNTNTNTRRQLNHPELYDPTTTQGRSRSRDMARRRADAPRRAKQPVAPAGDGNQWNQLQVLKNLLDQGFISQTEFADRKRQIVDEMTGTSASVTEGSPVARETRDRPHVNVPTIIPHPPPDFKNIRAETAGKYVYDLTTHTWRSSQIKVKLDPQPFGKGALRLCYFLQDLSAPSAKKDKKKKEKSDSVYVAKISMDPRDNENRAIYFRDVEMQTVAKYYADQFNEYNPPKKVDFVKAWLLKLEDRQGKPLCGVERFIEGSYRKHNNNFGYVSEDDRNTPQAFSHFTYEASNHQMLVCDIQGVSDLYTDPQLHCVDNKHNFGKGNLGQRGIDRFLQTHRCNVICRYLKLPEVNANYDEDNGTLPLTQYMSCEQVGNVDVAIFQKESTGGLGPLEPLLTPPTEPEAKCCCVMQ